MIDALLTTSLLVVTAIMVVMLLVTLVSSPRIKGHLVDILEWTFCLWVALGLLTGLSLWEVGS